MRKGREKMKKYIIALLMLFILLLGSVGGVETGRIGYWQGMGQACACLIAMAVLGRWADKLSRGE